MINGYVCLLENEHYMFLTIQCSTTVKDTPAQSRGILAPKTGYPAPKRGVLAPKTGNPALKTG